MASAVLPTAVYDQLAKIFDCLVIVGETAPEVEVIDGHGGLNNWS